MNDRERSALMVQLRISHGGSESVCPTCCCPREKPYRRTIDGAIVEGCIDASHTEDLLDRSAEDADRIWHERPEAQKLREGEVLRLMRIDQNLAWWLRERFEDDASWLSKAMKERAR